MNVNGNGENKCSGRADSFILCISLGFEEERAIVLGRLKRFEQAIYIYVHRIKDLEKAEE